VGAGLAAARIALAPLTRHEPNCFGQIDHDIFLSIFSEHVHDRRLLTLVENLLRAGYLEGWDYHPTRCGVPQGGVIGPLFSNIYLDKLDTFVEHTLFPEYRGLLYKRYADDFLLGTGSRRQADEIKFRIGEFLRDSLRLELSEEKTLITHAPTEYAKFLGYEIGTIASPSARRSGGVVLRMPPRKLDAKIAQYQSPRLELIDKDDCEIVQTYAQEYRGFSEYYQFASNRFRIERLYWAMEASLLKTLAIKYQTSKSAMERKYVAETRHQGRTLRCLQAVRPRPNQKSLIAKFGKGVLRTVSPSFRPGAKNSAPPKARVSESCAKTAPVICVSEPVFRRPGADSRDTALEPPHVVSPPWE
jgi:hypothetical protein